ncbi:MAG TPA: hypothetical protein VFQ79_20890 [Bryobacteraceae bacterium]|nr:hypothetical protein [Bryobacteraceae bacterium]
MISIRSTVVAAFMGLAFTWTATAQVNFGLAGGLAGSATKEGLAGYTATGFGRSASYGGGGGYRFRNGLIVDGRFEQLQMRLSEDGADMGSLRLRPAVITVGYQGIPAKGRGFSGHAYVGGGVAFSSFRKGNAITALERQYGGQMVVETKSAPALIVGAGIDYFLSPRVSLTSDFRFVGANVGTSWAAVGPGGRAALPFEKFFVSNGQVVGGMKFWLK